MKKAQMLGIQIQQNTSSQLDFLALFAHDEMQDVPTGFEQINDNLYTGKIIDSCSSIVQVWTIRGLRNPWQKSVALKMIWIYIIFNA